MARFMRLSLKEIARTSISLIFIVAIFLTVSLTKLNSASAKKDQEEKFRRLKENSEDGLKLCAVQYDRINHYPPIKADELGIDYPTFFTPQHGFRLSDTARLAYVIERGSININKPVPPPPECNNCPRTDSAARIFASHITPELSTRLIHRLSKEVDRATRAIERDYLSFEEEGSPIVSFGGKCTTFDDIIRAESRQSNLFRIVRSLSGFETNDVKQRKRTADAILVALDALDKEDETLGNSSR